MSQIEYGKTEAQWQETERRLEWFKQAKYGMFIHWGLYSIPAGIWKGREIGSQYTEWLMFRERIPFAEYSPLAKEFNPTAFNAEEWVQIVRDAGMKYITITAKHHDGFAMYRSKASDYNIVDATPFKRDPMEELAAACDKHGIKLCFYYSQCLDWSHPDAFKCGPEFYPELVEQGYEPDPMRYVEEKVKPQLTELLTNYGDIGGIWCDTPWYTNESDELRRTWGKMISEHIRSVNNDVLINSRIVGKDKDKENYSDLYDYFSLKDLAVIGDVEYEHYTESPDCVTTSYGYDAREGAKLLPAQEMYDRLRAMNDNNGNLLLNVGPTGEGNISPSAVRRLMEVRKLMDAAES